MTDIQQFRTEFERRKGERRQIQESIDDTESKIKKLEKRQRRLEKAQLIIQTVARNTQEELEYHVSELVTLAHEAVFEDPYELDLEFILKRGRTEAVLMFKRGENKVHPMSAAGGGVIDVASFALRVSLWSLARPRTRNVLILDEPFKNINDPTREMHRKAAEMLKMVAERLGLQIIIVTLLPEMIETADRVFEVKKIKGRSVVEVR